MPAYTVLSFTALPNAYFIGEDSRGMAAYYTVGGNSCVYTESFVKDVHANKLDINLSSYSLNDLHRKLALGEFTTQRERPKELMAFPVTLLDHFFHKPAARHKEVYYVVGGRVYRLSRGPTQTVGPDEPFIDYAGMTVAELFDKERDVKVIRSNVWPNWIRDGLSVVRNRLGITTDFSLNNFVDVFERNRVRMSPTDPKAVE